MSEKISSEQPQIKAEDLLDNPCFQNMDTFPKVEVKGAKNSNPPNNQNNPNNNESRIEQL